MNLPNPAVRLSVTTLFIFLFAISIFAQTSAFTYQGKLTDGSGAANGTYQMQFSLYDALSDGTPQGATVTNNSVTVVSGIFNVSLDFGSSVFTGGDRFLEIAVKKNGETSLTTLAPRQPLTSSPYSIRTLSAASSDSLSPACLGCVTDAKIQTVSGTKITGTVANATSAATAANVTGTVAIANGGTGSTTQNFVDLSTDQFIGGNKTFTDNLTIGGDVASSGNIKIPAAKDYQYATAQTRYYSVSAFAFHPESSIYGRGSSNGSIYADSGTSTSVGYFDAPFYLPDGATVTAVTFYVFDNDGTYNIQPGQLWRNDAAPGTQFGNSTIMAQTPSTTGSNTNIQSLNTMTITSPVINNQTYAYYLRWGTYQNNTNLRLAKVLITYTVAKAN